MDTDKKEIRRLNEENEWLEYLEKDEKKQTKSKPKLKPRFISNKQRRIWRG